MGFTSTSTSYLYLIPLPPMGVRAHREPPAIYERKRDRPRRPADRVFDARGPLDLLGGRHHSLPVARILDDAWRRAACARAAADDQELARPLRAAEQVGEGPGVADVAAVAQNHPAALIRNPYLSSEPNKIPLVIKGESPILAEAWWPISAGYQYGSGASSAGAPASDSWALRGP